MCDFTYVRFKKRRTQINLVRSERRLAPIRRCGLGRTWEVVLLLDLVLISQYVHFVKIS